MLVERHEGLKTITLNSPATSNSLTSIEVEDLLRAVRESCSDGTETLVFTAIGPNFCSGFDLSNLDEARDGDLLLRFVRIELLLQAVYMAQFDTVACAKGATYGAGADLFAACRCRLADPGARFLMPGLQFGVALGTRRFAEIVGETQAYELLAWGIPFDSELGRKVGFVTQVAQEDQWPEPIRHRHQSRRVRGEALTRLSRLTRRDTCAQDMLALVESAGQPGLVERIRRYREKVQAQRKPKAAPVP
jgi:enoyl-CoA hydratase/carnithine racemase